MFYSLDPLPSDVVVAVADLALQAGELAVLVARHALQALRFDHLNENLEQRCLSAHTRVNKLVLPSSTEMLLLLQTRRIAACGSCVQKLGGANGSVRCGSKTGSVRCTVDVC